MKNFTTWRTTKYKEFISKLPSELPFKKPYKKELLYCNIPFVFDIETTSFYRNLTDNSETIQNIDTIAPEYQDEWEKVNFMYAFVFGFFFDGCMYEILGRTWSEYFGILKEVESKYNLDSATRLIVWVHNLSYEFQYLRMRHEWEKIFALEERKTCTALTKTGIEYRCSYILSGYSLASVGKNLLKYKVAKMEGDLDYTLIRHSGTLLTDAEEEYIYHDGYVVLAYIQEEIENTRRKNICDLPLTNTGRVRNYTRKKCLNATKEDKYKCFNYHNLMGHLQIKDNAELMQLMRAFHGGFTHASNKHANKTLNNVTSYDFTSSYPSVCVARCQFPMSQGKLIKLKSKEHFKECLYKYCCLFDVEFTNLNDKLTFEHPMSESKCFYTDNVLSDNGRVICANKVRITITEQDYFVFEKFYSWDSMKIANFRIYQKGYLPKDFVLAILDLYETKTQYKDLIGYETEYMHAKGMLNSVFGMCVTSLIRPEIEYINNEWNESPCDIENAIEKYNKSLKRFISYGWGVWITAIAFNNLFTGIYECKEDYVYSDTDSIKILNADKHIKYIEAYNKRIIRQLKDACKWHEIPFEKCSPKDKNGIQHPLGVWSFDGHYTLFKTLGAKRYLCVDSKKNELHLTVSGINKKTCVPYLLKTYKDYNTIFNAFNNGLVVPKGACGKNIHTYIDYAQNGVILDVYGNMGEYNELSSVHMEETSYNLTMPDDYLDYILGYREFRR